MYHAHFGLTATPFTSQPIAANYVPTDGHEEALARLEFLAETQSGSGLLLGPAGSGKTLLLEVFARRCRRRGIMAAQVSAAQSDESELLFSIAAQLGVSLGGTLPHARLSRALSDRLTELRYDQVSSVILVDDLDRADLDRLGVLDGLLTSLQRTPLLTVVLSGTSDAIGRLSIPMRVRADLQVDVPVWDQGDVRKFISYRLAQSGCTAALFDDGAISVLWEASGGNPRHVGQLANLSLIAAAAHGLGEVDSQIVEEVCRELCVSQA